MSKSIIVAEKLGKAYRIGLRYERHKTFRDAIMNTVKSPVRRFRTRGEVDLNAKDSFWAIRNVDFEVKPGEVVGLIGRNGAGKSTLLKVLSRIVEPTEGRAELRGRVASLLEVGTGFHPELSGRENIYLNGAILGMRKTEIDANFNAIVEFSEVGRFLDTPVKRYSSGMYVRLAFAVAAHLEPEILIVDEVLAVGDAAFQKKCLGKMGDVVRHGRTVVFVSHNMDAVMGLCSSVFLMRNGQISEPMPTADGVKQYLSQNEEESSVPLAERKRFQSKDRLPIFTDIKVLGSEGHIGVVDAGGPATFEITLSNAEDVRSGSVGIALHNDRSQRIVLLHSEYNSKAYFGGKTSQKVVCHIPSLPLAPGPYQVELVLSDGYQVVERVDRADRINVVFSDYYGTGKLPNNSQSQFLIPCKWEESAA